jgi:hypothetical protein
VKYTQHSTPDDDLIINKLPHREDNYDFLPQGGKKKRSSDH